MIVAMRAYANAPSSIGNVAVLTQTETVVSSSAANGATGAEFANSRLGNFLSDDPAPKDRDLDTLMKGDTLGLYDKGPDAPVKEPVSRSDVTVAPPPENVEPISLPPTESLLNSQMQQAETVRQEMVFKGATSGSYAQQMYTNTQDVLSRIAA